MEKFKIYSTSFDILLCELLTVKAILLILKLKQPLFHTVLTSTT